jgi:hypothetical protein
VETRAASGARRVRQSEPRTQRPASDWKSSIQQSAAGRNQTGERRIEHDYEDDDEDEKICAACDDFERY